MVYETIKENNLADLHMKLSILQEAHRMNCCRCEVLDIRRKGKTWTAFVVAPRFLGTGSKK